MEPARPVQILTVTITPKTHGDHALMRALEHLSIEDPAIRIAWSDSETGRVTLAGAGETHLEVIIDRDSIVGAPRKPVVPTRTSGIALPEPADDDPDEDEWHQH